MFIWFNVFTFALFGIATLIWLRLNLMYSKNAMHLFLWALETYGEGWRVLDKAFQHYGVSDKKYDGCQNHLSTYREEWLEWYLIIFFLHVLPPRSVPLHKTWNVLIKCSPSFNMDVHAWWCMSIVNHFALREHYRERHGISPFLRANPTCTLGGAVCTVRELGLEC